MNIADKVQSVQDHITAMELEKKKQIEYVIGIDLGHGETSAAICPMQWGVLDNLLDPATDLEMEPNRKVIPSAITITADGAAKIGTAAFDPYILKKANVNVCFKKKPERFDGEDELLMIRFMQEVYRKIRENNIGLLKDGNHLVYIATPSGWDKEAQALYLEMARKAGLPMGGITKESRAAFVRAQHDPTANLGRNIEKGAIVFDMGSSTLDFTYHNADLTNMIDNGYDCGASAVEWAMFRELEKNNESIRLFCERYPDLIDFVVFETRKAKESIYFDSTIPYKKSVNFEDFIDDEDLEDERFRFKYAPGELNQFLEEQGYVDKIREAMKDFITNHIPSRPIYGVFLTGGASRMDFIKPLVANYWNVPEDKIFRDQDPSLTISQGVAEVARIDMRTADLYKELKPLLQKVSGAHVYEAFVKSFGTYFANELIDKLKVVMENWRDSKETKNLHELNSEIKLGINEIVSLGSIKINNYLNEAIELETQAVRKKVDAIVVAYTMQGTIIEVPTIKGLEVANGSVGVDMTSVMKELADKIETENFNWDGAITGAGIGAALAIFFGGPLAWIVAGGAAIGSWLFSEEETEEQKKGRAMNKKLDANERAQVVDAMNKEWGRICDDIRTSVFSSLNRNKHAKQQVIYTVSNLMTAYKDALKKARIMVD